MYGVFITILLKGILDVKLEINIKVLRLKFNGIANNLAKKYEIRDIKTVMKPKIIFIPKNGLASMLDIKNVSEILLNLIAMIGIMAI